MELRGLATALCAASFLATAALPLHAQRGTPASLLLFPEYDAQEGAATVLTVTNSHPDEAILVRYHYVDGATCEYSDRTEFLTPQDTLTVLVGVHLPWVTDGYVYVTAVSPDTGNDITFNHLMGMATVIDGVQGLSYTVEPYTFRGRTIEGGGTDLDDDGFPDLDGKEYQPVPDVLAFPRFVGQEPGFLPEFGSYLVLVNLTAAPVAETTVEFLVWNDNEEVFSAGHSFFCWMKVPLLEISGLFSNDFLRTTNHDPGEVLGLPELEAGWFRVDGGEAVTPGGPVLPDPALLGMLVDRWPANCAYLPFGMGRQGNAGLLWGGIP